MPRPRKLRDAVVVPLVLERSLYNIAKQVARARHTSVSHLVREALKQYLEEEATRLGIQVTFSYIKNSEGHETVERTDILKILNEPALEDLDRQLKELEEVVAALEKVADKKYYGHGYYAPDFSKQLDYAWHRMISMKKLAEKLARLDMLDIERARKAVNLERRLKRIRRRK